MTDLKSDIVGRVNRLPLHPNDKNALLPLMEAISNSVHAFTDLYGQDASTKGRIIVRVKRDSQKTNGRVIGFEIEDNGMGFIDENFHSFQTPDSRFKEKRGGKGVGRLAWLKVFQRIEIDSTFKEHDKWRRRLFTFRLSDSDQIVEQISAVTEEMRRTTVRFTDFMPGFIDRCPIRENVIQNRIAAHFVSLFVAGNAPRVSIEDSQNMDLETVFSESILDQCTHEVDIGEGVNKFTLKIWSLKCSRKMKFEPEAFNFGFVAGDNRSVIDYPMDEQLGLKLLENDAIYIGCASSPFLDQNVNSERTAFTLEASEIESIKSAMVNVAREFLSVDVDRSKAVKIDAARQVIAENPQFLYINNKLESFADSLQANAYDKEEIFVAMSRDRYRQHKRFAGVKKAIKADEKINGKIDDKVKEYSTFVADDKRGALAEYVIRRKAVLDLFENLLEYKDKEAENYNREDTMHELFCPMRITSGELRIADHNLWLLDDRLAFFDYFASDKRLSAFTESDSNIRPDLAFFYNACVAWRALNNTDTIIIVEFKKPMRNTYPTSENDPVQQVLSYVKRLKSSRSEPDLTGKPIRGIQESTSFHCYIVADITPELEDQIIGRFQKTPDGDGYFGYTKNPDAFVEIIPFGKVLNDARMRNSIFFQKLGITATG